MSKHVRIVGVSNLESHRILHPLHQSGIHAALQRTRIDVTEKPPLVMSLQQVEAEGERKSRYRATLYYPETVIVAESGITNYGQGHTEFTDSMVEEYPAPRVSRIRLDHDAAEKAKLTVSAVHGGIYFESTDEDRLVDCSLNDVAAVFRRWLCHPTK